MHLLQGHIKCKVQEKSELKLLIKFDHRKTLTSFLIDMIE